LENLRYFGRKEPGHHHRYRRRWWKRSNRAFCGVDVERCRPVKARRY
jgi:hypothetical protein